MGATPAARAARGSAWSTDRHATATAWWASRAAAGRRLLARRPAAAAAVLGAFLVAALFHVWSRLAVVELGYRLAAARTAHATLLEQNRRLKLELAMLKAPGRLEEVARERFGLAAPHPSQIIHLDAAPASRASR